MKEVSEEKITDISLVQKLAKIRTMAAVVKKNKEGFNYKYTDISEILANVTAGMKKYGVSLIPQIVPQTLDISPREYVKYKYSKDGERHEENKVEYLIKADMTFTWINDNDDSERLTIPWVLTGCQEDPSQGLGGAITYCTRYFLTSYFQIAQSENDVDEYLTRQKQAETLEERTIAEEIINNFDSILKIYLSDNKEKSDEVKNFIERYAKKGNYFAIKEPTLASKLFNDFKENFIKGVKE